MILLRRKSINYIAPMILFVTTIFILTHFITIPTPAISSTPSYQTPPLSRASRSNFRELKEAFNAWDSYVGCRRFQERVVTRDLTSNGSSLQDFQCDDGSNGGGNKIAKKTTHVSVLVKGWTWIPDNLDNLYTCGCGLSCLWSKSDVLVDRPDALLFENVSPPRQRRRGEPLRAYIDLESGRKPTGIEDIFIGYHANDDIQTTYAGAFFHNNRNYHISETKSDSVLVYWSSSRCLPERNKIAKEFLSLIPHHSIGKCLNNINGLDLYPECSSPQKSNGDPKWWENLHCTMSHYKFSLAIENKFTDSYITEKLFYALDSGSVPIYFGAPNVWDFVPPHSIIDGSKFRSMKELASYVKALADDPVAYAEYHAWRRCGVLGNYFKTRSLSLDTLPCRLCQLVSTKGGRNA
ncbi:Alpha-1,4-fucosyltransferase, family GT10 [Zostera marina]|uniref:Fucosyltransferase n=1 Tax=Zostera marina TaxID=29655 RepID=A0A0K9NSF2_ZOSMR|nr:Alpha-1,4-fucosyltransferase, family GT10 [Zostera marina]